MRTLELPERFPLPQNMKNSPVATWVQWIRDESNKLIAAIDEEISRRQDPDDPFDGTASGIFPPLQNIDELQQGTTPKAQSNQVKVDESTNRSPRTGGTLTGKLVDVQSPPPRQVNSSQQNQRRMTSLSQEQQQVQVPASDSSQNRTDAHGEQGEMRATTSQSTALTSTQRRVEESQPEVPPEMNNRLKIHSGPSGAFTRSREWTAKVVISPECQYLHTPQWKGP